MKNRFGLLAPLILLWSLFGMSAFADEVDLRPQMTVVKSQGNRGTCSSFAATALMEFLVSQNEGVNLDLSEAFTYYLGKTKALDTPYVKKIYSKGEALAGYLAVRAFMFGCMVESEWPYKSENYRNSFIGKPPKGAKQLPYRIEPILIKPENIAKFILSVKKPVVYNLLWCQSAVDNRTGKYRLPSEAELKDPAGHVILLVGYNSETREFIFRNCWGPDWGDHGYGTIPEDYVLKYGEVSQFKPFEQHPDDVREFLETASMGISGSLDEYGF